MSEELIQQRTADNNLFSDEPFIIKGHIVHPSKNTIEFQGEIKSIEKKSMQVLVYLAKYKDRVVSNKELIDAIWNGNMLTGVKAVKNTIWKLRSLLPDEHNNSPVIETIHGKGYQLIADVSSLDNCGQHTNKGSPLIKNNIFVLVLLLFGISLIAFWWMDKYKENEQTQPVLSASRITNAPGNELYPSLSPDNKYVVFTKINMKNTMSRLFIKAVDNLTSQMIRLTDGEQDRHPVWSPNGDQVAFTRINSKGKCKIYTVSIVTRVEKFITTCQIIHDYGFDWSPDGSSLAYIDGKKNNPAVYLINISTGKKQQLTCKSQCDWISSELKFSPDGSQLAILSSNDNFRTSNIFTLSLKGNLQQQTFAEKHMHSMSWTKNGREILISSSNDDILKVWRIKLSTGEFIPLTLQGSNVGFPQLSKDGSLLAYVETNSRDFYIDNVELFNDSDKPTSQILIDTLASDRWLSSNSDSSKFIYVSNINGEYRIWLADNRGTPIKQLKTKDLALIPPAISPDGNNVAYIEIIKGDIVLKITNTENQQQLTLANLLKEPISLCWSRDNHSLLVVQNDSQGTSLWEYTFDNLIPKKLTVTNPGSIQFSLDGKTLFYTKYESSQLWQKQFPEGKESILLDNFYPDEDFNWAVADKGIYFLMRTAQEDQIWFLDFLEKQSNLIHFLPPDTIAAGGKFNWLSNPDRLLIEKLRPVQSDVMLISYPL